MQARGLHDRAGQSRERVALLLHDTSQCWERLALLNGAGHGWERLALLLNEDVLGCVGGHFDGVGIWFSLKPGTTVSELFLKCYCKVLRLTERV